MKHVLAACLLVVFAISCGGGGEEGATVGVETGSAPIIILAVDGLRADALGCYGAPAATPAFDALAAESIRFEWAFAQAPQLQPSLATMLSGLYPTSNGLRQPGEFLSKDATTLAEVLGAAGYATGAFLEGAASSGDYGLAQGFESFAFSDRPGDETVAWMTGRATGDFLAVFGGWSKPALDKVNALLAGGGQPDDFSQRVQEVLASRLTDSPEEFTSEELEWVRSWYAARTQVIDSLLAGFMDEFRALGLDKRAILVVVGSNGFALQEHGGLFGENLFTPVTRVPMLLRLPDGAKAQVVTKMVEVVDLMPTLLELVGQATPAGVQGASLLPIVEGAGQPPYIAFAESPQAGGQRFVALGGMGLVSGPAGADAEIYDLALDPLQLENLADDQPDKVEVMVRHLQAWEKLAAVASLDPNLRAEEDLDEETLKQLKSLGYIQ